LRTSCVPATAGFLGRNLAVVRLVPVTAGIAIGLDAYTWLQLFTARGYRYSRRSWAARG